VKQNTTRNQEQIGHAIDSGQRMPDELLAEISKDPALQRFQMLSLHIASELRLNADQWAHQCRSPKQDWSALAAGSDSSTFGERDTNSCRTAELPELTRNPRTQEMQDIHRSTGNPTGFLLTFTAVLVLLVVGSVFVDLGMESSVDSGNASLRSSGKKISEPVHPGLQSTTKSRPQAPPNTQSAHGVASTQHDQEPVDQEQFEQYFYVTVASTFKTLQSVSETLTERAVGKPLQRTIELATKSEITASGEAPESDSPRPLDAKQIQLIRDFQQTTDFLTERLPKAATHSWMELSYANRRSP